MRCISQAAQCADLNWNDSFFVNSGIVKRKTLFIHTGSKPAKIANLLIKTRSIHINFSCNKQALSYIIIYYHNTTVSDVTNVCYYCNWVLQANSARRSTCWMSVLNFRWWCQLFYNPAHNFVNSLSFSMIVVPLDRPSKHLPF